LRGLGKTDQEVVGCAAGWYAVRMQQLCSGENVGPIRNHSTTSNRS
jgi:hypothetical protein